MGAGACLDRLWSPKDGRSDEQQERRSVVHSYRPGSDGVVRTGARPCRYKTACRRLALPYRRDGDPPYVTAEVGLWRRGFPVMSA